MSNGVQSTETSTCFWCEDSTPNHSHYTVLAYEHGKLLGRLTPDGGVTNRKMFATVLSKARADEVAARINAAGVFTAKAMKF